MTPYRHKAGAMAYGVAAIIGLGWLAVQVVRGWGW